MPQAIRSFISPAHQVPGGAPFRIALILLAASLLGGGCATVRVTDPPRTATEQFLLSGAAQSAVTQLNMDGLRDQLVYIDQSYFSIQPGPSDLFLLGEVRARLLKEGARITDERDKATVIVEIRSGGLGTDRYEYLLGIPAIVLAQGGVTTVGGVPIATPELAILKNTKQRGFASIAIVAYRAGTGELVTQSGPFVGETSRDDYWIFGTGPTTTGDIPPAE